ncbi:hypothetical protein B0H14DRAFT_3469903 [Mycena olivaceomarginata]|nr:hypothetical protein B0H14DRAFT_3469903 [Mycena olivaceomarginata]
MSPNECTTFPPDGELALYRATNNTDPALTVNHIYGGNLVAVPTGCPYSGTHSFVYGNRVETAGRYPSPLRVGAVGEVCTMARTEIGAPKSFFVRSPSTATAGAVCHHQATIALLLYVLDSEAEQVGSVEGMGRWVEGNESQSANRYLVIGEVIDGAVVAVEFTLHRYNHYAWGPVKRRVIARQPDIESTASPSSSQPTAQQNIDVGDRVWWPIDVDVGDPDNPVDVDFWGLSVSSAAQSSENGVWSYKT